MPTEWLALGSNLRAALAGTHFAWSAVRPATAVLTGTNHSAWLCVERSCKSRMLRRVGGGGAGFGCGGLGHCQWSQQNCWKKHRRKAEWRESVWASHAEL